MELQLAKYKTGVALFMGRIWFGRSIFFHTVEKYFCDTNTMVIIIRVMNQVGDVLRYIH